MYRLSTVDTRSSATTILRTVDLSASFRPDAMAPSVIVGDKGCVGSFNYPLRLAG